MACQDPEVRQRLRKIGGDIAETLSYPYSAEYGCILESVVKVSTMHERKSYLSDGIVRGCRSLFRTRFGGS